MSRKLVGSMRRIARDKSKRTLWQVRDELTKMTCVAASSNSELKDWTDWNIAKLGGTCFWGRRTGKRECQHFVMGKTDFGG